MATVTQKILYLASANPGKVREFSEAARELEIVVEPVPGIRSLPPCVEDGATFEENARKKALHYSAYVKGWVFADDSGISVDALGGAPGVHSARYAGPEATDAANNAKLLAALGHVESGRKPAPRRDAHYVCVIALANSGRIQTVVEGRADGIILDTPRGSGGFGYDPYFYYPPLGKTFAELTLEEKFSVSHRGKAFRGLLDYLERSGWGD
ncbi:MAG TPA: RdgB/HAM1 family non-canonical purine NTP pyrophosphatase [Terriglobia bacterium]|nr:RdgB/HAM1 family non-canonical purine NTP pyrophosphatase [Terriglobia bacterium]